MRTYYTRFLAWPGIVFRAGFRSLLCNNVALPPGVTGNPGSDHADDWSRDETGRTDCCDSARMRACQNRFVFQQTADRWAKSLSAGAPLCLNPCRAEGIDQ
jgi:hypothetical protein